MRERPAGDSRFVWAVQSAASSQIARSLEGGRPEGGSGGVEGPGGEPRAERGKEEEERRGRKRQVAACTHCTQWVRMGLSHLLNSISCAMSCWAATQRRLDIAYQLHGLPMWHYASGI